jgi:hypothetical protein
VSGGRRARKETTIINLGAYDRLVNKYYGRGVGTPPCIGHGSEKLRPAGGKNS